MPTISTPTTAPVTLLAGTELLVERLGSVVVDSMSHAVTGAGNNKLSVLGTVASFGMNTNGVQLNAGGNQVTVTTTGHLYGANVGLTIVGAGSNFVTNGGTIEGGGNAAISVSGGGNSFNFVASSVIQSAGRGLNVSNGNNDLINKGYLAGALLTGGANVVTNDGTIIGKTSAALEFAAGGAFSGENLVTNYGTIRTSVNLTNAITAGAPKLVMFNSGTIESVLDDAVSALANTGGTQITNTGWIVAAKVALDLGSNAVDIITNNGGIVGGTAAALLKGGNDVFDGTNGTTIGVVDGGAGEDTLTGGDEANTLLGGADKDTLSGGGGADTLDGGIGNDIYMLGSEVFTDTILDASGTDVIFTSVGRSMAGAPPIENILLQGAGNIQAIGNANPNGMTGNSGNNTFYGQGGNDTIIGGGGNDQFYGQGGKDTHSGGAGNDKYFFQSAGETAFGNGDVIVDFEDAGLGDDTVDLTGIAGVTSFIGGNAFSAPGQVRLQQVGADVSIEINTTGNSGAEGQIWLLNTTIGAGIGQFNGADLLL